MESKVVCIDRASSKPDKGSPCGLLMSKIMEKNPAMSFEDARLEAHRLLDIAAGKRTYHLPMVLSPAEKAAKAERLRATFGRSRKSANAA